MPLITPAGLIVDFDVTRTNTGDEVFRSGVFGTVGIHTDLTLDLGDSNLILIREIHWESGTGQIPRIGRDSSEHDWDDELDQLGGLSFYCWHDGTLREAKIADRANLNDSNIWWNESPATDWGGRPSTYNNIGDVARFLVADEDQTTVITNFVQGIGTPAAPAAPTLTAGDAVVGANWAEPDDFNSAITGYDLQYSINNGGSYTTVDVGNVLTYDITSLTNGVAVLVSVRARNDVGNSDYGPTASATPVSSDLTPVITNVANQSVNWGAPLSVTLPAAMDGDPPLTYSVSGLPAWASFNTGTRLLSGTAEGLAATSAITYTVEDADGDTDSTTFDIVVSAIIPPASTQLTAVAGDQQIALTWTLNGNGGSPLTAQRVRYQRAGQNAVFMDVTTTATSALVTGLDNGFVYEMRVLVINSQGRADSATILVTPSSQAPPPVASFTSAVTNLAVQFTDTSTGAPTSWAWDFGDNNTSTDQSPSHTYANGNTFTVTLTATNADGSDSFSAQVTVAAADLMPTAPTVPNQSGKVNDAFSATLPVGTGGDPPLTYAVSGQPSWASFDTGTRVLSGTPNAASTTTVTYTVTDDDGDSDDTTFAISIVADRMPTAPTVGAQTGTTGLAFSVTLPVGTGGDPPLAYSVSGEPSWASFNTTTRVLSGTPNAVASTTVTYTVTDTDGDADSTTFTVTVAAAGSMPTGLLADFTLTVTSFGGSSQVNGTWAGDRLVEFSNGETICVQRFFWDTSGVERKPLLADEDNTIWDRWDDNVAEMQGNSFYIWDGSNVNEAAVSDRIDVNDDSMNWNQFDRPSSVVIGSVLRFIYATSGQAAVVSNFVQLSNPPVASFTSAVTNLAVAFTDTSTNTPTSWAWDFGDNNTSTDQNPSHTYASAGTRTVTLTATNTDGSDSTSAQVTTTAPDTQPTAPAVADQSGTVGVAFSTTLPAGTGGNPPLSYVVTGRPAWLAFNATSRVLSGTPTAAGTTTLTYTVTDTDGDADSTTFTIIIVAADLTPTLPTVVDQTIDWGDALSVTLPAATSGDTPLTYSLTGLPTWATFNTGTRLLSGTAAGLAATSALTYTVTDTDGDTDVATFDLTVDAIAPPAATNLVASPGETTIALTWQQNGNGGAAFTSQLARGQASGDSAIFISLPFTATSVTFTGLNPDTEYSILVRLRTTLNIDVNSASITASTTSADLTPNAPTVAAQSGVVGAAFSVTLPVGTGGNAPLTYSVTGAPSWASFNTGTRLLSGTPDAVATTIVTYTVTDDDGDSDSAMFDIVIAAALPDPPVAGFTSSTNDLTASFTDTSTNAPTSWLWDFDDSGSSTAQNPSHTYASAGTYTVQLTATNTGGSNIFSADVTVTAPDTSPTAPTIANQGAVVGTAYSITLAVGTGGDPPLSYAVTGRPAWLAFNATSRVLSGTPTAAGTSALTYTVTDVDGDSDSGNFNLVVTAGLPDPPVTNFSRAITNLSVAFTDTSTNTPTSWSWDFGDGGSSTAQNPSHTYASAGTYTVTLTATNAGGSNDRSKTFTVTAPPVPVPPVASFTSSVSDLVVAFTDTSAESPTSWSWSFGDGGTSTQQNPSHTYVAAGTYSVVLTATNSDGSDTASANVTVVAALPNPPVANFSRSVSNLTVTFTDSSTGNPTSWSWDFGDGNTSTTQDPIHAYLAAGTFTVELIATNAGGSDDRSRNVTVTEPLPDAPGCKFHFVCQPSGSNLH